MEQHAHRGKKDGEQDFKHHAEKEPECTAKRFSVSLLYKDQKQAQKLWSEQDYGSCREQSICPLRIPRRPLRKQGVTLGKVDRGAEDFGNGLDSTEAQKGYP